MIQIVDMLYILIIKILLVLDIYFCRVKRDKMRL